MAILALVTGVIGSVIVISTRTYRRGISETNIQQEAQLAANNIGNMVKDACSVVYGESGAQYIKNGKELMSNADATPKMQAAGFTELSIITNEKIQYTMTFDESNKKILYQEYNTTDGLARTNPEIMATNIVDFKADTTDFENSKTIKLSMKVEDSDTNRSIPMEYTMTSRNGDGEGGEYVTNTDSVVIIFLEDDVVLVPGETYQIPLSVTGKLNEGGLEWDSVSGVNAGALTMDYAEVTVPIDSMGAPASFSVRTKDKDGDGNPKDTASCNVGIRKVSGVAVSHSIDTKDSRDGMLETAGTVYTFNANISGSELTKRVAYAYDSNYKTAQAVVWSWELVADGVTYKREWTCSQNAGGRYEFAESTDGDQSKFDEYLSVTLNKEDAIIPQLIMKIEKDMPADFVLTVRATSKHALGVNKADSKYGDKDDAAYFGEDVVKPRETIVNKNLEIILEPQETGTLNLGMKGGLTSDVTFEYHDATDLRTDTNTNGTTAIYNDADDTVSITLGKDEKGSGPVAAGDPYTFTIDVKVQGVTKTTITVHVCRVDALSIEVFDNFHADKNDGKPDKVATYDFRARINVTTGINDPIMQKAIQHLIQYKEDGTPDKEVVKNTLSSRITWELFDHSASGGSKAKYSGSVVCLAGVGAGDKGEIIGSYKKEEKGYYKIENIKPSRIEQNPDGTWFIKQLPEIDIVPLANTDTGLLPNYELKVTIEALHPIATDGGKTYNKTGSPYGVAKDSVSIKGELTLDTPTQVVVVEPGQGTNDPAQSDTEMVVPIEVHGSAVYRMSVKISGNSSKGTKLSSYPKANDKNGNYNPYMSGNATSAGQMRTWYMGLLIDEDEKGNGDGRIQIHIDAYNSQNKIIATTDFELGVRRVDKITVKVADSKKINDINKEGSTVKLEAFPKGCGDNGTEFYDIQRDSEGNICRWEKEGHGEYKEPYPMEWRILINGTEKPLAEWTEYIDVEESVKPKTATVPDKHKATVTFKLKQPLPAGTKIRAYSLHARGKVGDTKYNKSEKKYDDLYGEIVISNRQLLGGFMRARMQNYTLPGFESGVIPQFKAKYFNTNDFQQYTFYRYREVNGKWSQYYKTDDNENYHAYVTGTRMARLFRTDKEYELDVVNVLYNTAEKAIYWPQDNSLLESGAGWKEAGYTLKNWDYSSKFTEDERKFECKQEYLIPKTEMYFAPSPGNQTIESTVQTVGSEANPIQVDGNGQGDPQKWFAVKMNPTAFDLPAAYADFIAILYKKVGNDWVEIPDVKNLQSTDHWLLQTQNPTITVGYTYGASGTYRICSYLKGMDWTDVSGDMFKPTYTTSYEDLPLYNLSDNTGVLYVELK